MIVSEERACVAERYSSAVRSSDLSVTADRTTDTDVLIAMGWLGNTLAASLYRLAVEFDAVRVQVRGKEVLMPIDRALILLKLSTLREAREQLGAFACAEATRMRFMQSDEEVKLLVGRVLDVFLDPTCHGCEGRGFNGGGLDEQAGRRIICRACKGSRERRASLGHNDEERAFATHMLQVMSQQRLTAEQAVGRMLRTTAKKPRTFA